MTLAAMAAGSLLVRPPTPIGQTRRSMRSRDTPARARRARNFAALLADPMRPSQANSPRRENRVAYVEVDAMVVGHDEVER